MLNLSPSSETKLSSCNRDLQRVFKEVAKTVPFLVITAHRTEEEQNEAFNKGKSKKKWPESKHNAIPSDAIDVAPLPLDFSDREKFFWFAGFVLATASQLGIKIRWGGNWKNDLDFKANKFDDLVHFESA